jgi:serine/threonine protein kinase
MQICLAIQYMHANSVLHRDIKTQNIFLLGNGRLVLGDLGISKASPPQHSPNLINSRARDLRRC